MSNAQGKGRKALVIGVIAAVVVLAALLGVLLTQCNGADSGETTPSTTETAVVETYDLYWNIDRALYDGKSEAGMSSRTPEADGYFHVRFFKDGEIVTLKVVDRKVINALEARDLMGLEFDENGIVVGVLSLDEMPCEQVAWQFYVQSAGGKLIKANSSESLNGMEVLLECNDNTGIWDMTGMSGDVGCVATPIPFDRMMAIANAAGEVTHIFLYERSNYMRTHEAECEHCGKVVEWNEWIRTESIPNMTGHFQLMNDITTTGQTSMPEDAKICLDLNGKRIDGKKNARVYSLHNPGTELAIMDTSEEKTGTIAAHGQGDQGMCVWLRYGVVYMYAGILDASDAASIKNGTAVALQSSTYMYMHGGEIIGGTSKYLKQDNGKYTNGLAGSLYVAGKGKFVLNDGVIRDGKAQAIVTKRDASGQPSTYERGLGGNVFLASGSVMEMNGGTIKNGNAGNVGGNIYMDGTAEFTMKAGTISGGKITGKGRNGGNVYISTKSTFHMSGGSIINGSSRNCAGNVYINGKFTMTGGRISGGKIINWTTGKVDASSASRNVFIVNGNFAMYGGSIDGGVQAIDTNAEKTITRVTLSGYATINGQNGPNLTISSGGSGIWVNVGKLNDKAKIGVSTSVGLFSEPTVKDNLDSFFSDIEGADVVYFQDRLGLGRVKCMCGSETDEHISGCSKEQLFWAPWTSTSTLPTTSGNFYLLKDVTCGQQNVAGDAVIKLDLNGKRVEGKANSRIYSMHNRVETDNGDGTVTYSYPAHLTVTDTSDGRKGVMAAHGQAIHNGGIFWLRYGDVTVLAGTFDASDYKLHADWTAGTDGVFGTSDDGTSAKHGGAVHIPSGRTFTMYGGKIIGGEAATLELTKTNTIPVPEGAPEGTEPTKEEVKKTVTGGRGGAIDLSGKMYMYGGTVTGGVSAGNGGNFYIAKSGMLEMHGGLIENGWSKNVSGNIHLDGGTFTMTGGTITGGKTGASGGTTSENANIFSVNGKMNLSGGTITGHVRVANYNTDGAVNGSVVSISGNPVIYGGTANMVLAPQDDKTGTNDDGKTPTMPIIRVVGPMTAGANIHVNPTTGGIDFAIGEGYSVTAADAEAFTLQASDVKASADTQANALFFGRYNCLCGKSEHTFGCQQLCGGQQMKWFAWSSKTALPTTGNVYLVNDITGSGSTTVKTGTTLNLDLNGRTVSWKYRAYRIYDANAVANATLTITNTAATEGAIRAQELVGVDQGCAVWVAASENGVFNLLDGVVLDGSKYTIKNVPSEKNGAGSTAEKNGGTIAIQTGGVFNMYGGTVIGAKAVRSEEITLSNGTKYSSYAPNGAAVAVSSGTANMYGGEITGGNTANQGGNLMISGGKFNMSGGVISDGYAGGNSGNVFVFRTGEFHMSGDARVEGGESAGHSGNINVDGKMTMTDNAVVTGGKAAGAAGNINLNIITSGSTTYYGQLTMSGKSSVTDGEAATNSGNIRLLKGASMTMTDEALVSGGQAKAGVGGNINLNDADAKLTVSGSAVIKDGISTGNGGNVMLSGTSSMTVSGNAVISGGTCTGAKVGDEPTGGNISISGNGAKVTLSGNARVIDGKSYHTGGNIRISSGATLTVQDDAVISGGKSSNSKGDTTKNPAESNNNANIFCVNGNMEIFGGSITGNVNMITTNGNGSVKLAGDPVITAGVSGYGLYSSVSGSAAPVKFQITGAMTGEPGSVVIGISTGTGIIGSGSNYSLTDTDATVFASNGKGAAAGCVIVRQGNDLVVGGLDCLCGLEEHTKACKELWNSEERLWTAWTSTTTLPTTTGNYYLTNNVDFDWQQKIAKDANVVLDLNGYTVTNDNGQRMYSNWESGASLTITDKSDAQTGKFIASGDAVDQGVIWVRYGTFNLVAGTIDASGFRLRNVWDTSKNAIAYRNGGAIDVDGGTTFNMYGGTVIGAEGITGKETVNGEEKSLNGSNAASVAVSGTFNMYGGTIRDGKTTGSAGNIGVYSSGKMYMYEGAVVSGGSAYNGGNFSVEGGQLIIDGGKVIGGTSTNNGGNFRISGNGIVDLVSGSIEDGWGKNVSGNIHIDGVNATFNMSGGTVKGGKTSASAVTTATHANIQSVCGKWNFTGGTVEGNSMIHNYNAENSHLANTVLGGDATINGTLHLNWSDGKAAPVLTVKDDFSGSVTVTSKGDGIFTDAALTEEQAKCFVSGDPIKNIYRLTADMGVDAADVGKLYIGQIHCVCGASQNGGDHNTDVCDGTLHIWTPFSGTKMPVDGGYYYLTGSVKISSTATLTEVCDIVVDLNGYNITSSAARIYTTRNTADHAQAKNITFTNTYKGERVANSGRAKITVTGSGDQGRIVWLNGEGKSATLYNLDVDVSAATVNNASSKGGIALESSVENGTSNDNGSTTVWARNYINVYNVKMVGGTTHSNGQLLAIGGAATLTVKDSQLSGGNATHMNGATETTSGGKGGAIYASNNGKVVLHNTQITGCSATVNGGGVCMDGTSTLVISGNTKITGNTVNGAENNVYLAADAKLETGTLGSNAQVGLSGVTADVLSTDVTYAEMEAGFFSDSKTLQLVCMSSGLSLQDAAAHIHCVCGGTIKSGTKLADGTYHYCEDIVYTAYARKSGDITANTNGYLADDLVLTGQPGSGIYTLNLCLNGHNITTTANSRMFRTYNGGTGKGKITVTTCTEKENGNVISQKAYTGSSNGDGGIFWITNNGTLELYAGTIDASKYSLKPDSDDVAKHGCAVKVEGAGTFRMYGGTIIGGKTLKGTANNSEGAAVFVISNFIMTGGKIIGGETVGSGGSLFLHTGSVAKIYGGEITGGKATNNGGNIFYNGKELLIAGGKIENGVAGSRGGNIMINAAGATISGGTINAGEATDGGNVANGTDVSFELTGGNITGGKASSAGGNIWLMGPLNMTGGTVSGGMRGASDIHNTGANVSMNGTGALDISGGTIKGRVATLVAGSKLKISGSAKIYDTDTSNNLYVSNFATTIGKLNADAKIGLLILSESQVNTVVATVESGVTLDLAQFPVHDVGLTNSASRSFKAQQDGTSLKIVEVTN